MIAVATGSLSSWGQLITVLLIFVFVLVITAVTTRWLANYQKGQSVSGNIHVVESKRIAQNAFIQIVQIGDKYYAVAVGKDNVSLITELDDQTLDLSKLAKQPATFKDFLNKAKEKEKDQI